MDHAANAFTLFDNASSEDNGHDTSQEIDELALDEEEEVEPVHSDIGEGRGAEKESDGEESDDDDPEKAVKRVCHTFYCKEFINYVQFRRFRVMMMRRLSMTKLCPNKYRYVIFFHDDKGYIIMFCSVLSLN